MKILITTPELTNQGGVSNYYKALKNRFTANVEYFTVGSRSNQPGTWRTFSRFFTDNWNFYKKLRENNYDIVHLNPSLVSKAVIRDGIFLLIAKLMGYKVIVFFHGWDHAFEKTINNYLLTVFKYVFFKSDAFIVLARELKEKLTEMGFRKRIYLETTIVEEEYVKAFNISSVNEKESNSFNILFLGRIEKRKGIYEAVNAYRILKAKFKNINLIIAGAGSDQKAIQSYIQQERIEGVEFVGWVRNERKRQVFLNSDIYLFPTWAEGMPCSVLEAMAFGLPVVTRPVGGIKDFFEDGKMGFITYSHKPEVFADLIERMIKDRQFRVKVSSYNNQYAKEHFMTSTVVKRLENIYHSILKDSSQY